MKFKKYNIMLIIILALLLICGIIAYGEEICWIQGDLGQQVSSQNGIIRVAGDGLSSYEAAKLVSGQDEIPVIVASAEDNIFTLNVSNAAVGQYQLWGYNGSAWNNLGSIEVVSKNTPATVVNIADRGANPYSGDVTTIVKNAINELSTTGGTVYFPRGRYKLSQQLVIPENVTLKGEDETLTTIYWKQFENEFILILGEDNFTVQDMMIQTYGAHDDVISGRNNVTLKDVIIRADAYYHHSSIGLIGGSTSTEAVSLPETQLGSGICINGDNFSIDNCDVIATNRAVDISQSSFGYIANSKLSGGATPLYMVGSNNCILEKNQIAGANLYTDGINISTSSNLLINGNDILNIYGCDGKGIYSSTNAVNNILISDNSFKNMGAYGIDIPAASKCYVKNNTFDKGGTVKVGGSNVKYIENEVLGGNTWSNLNGNLIFDAVTNGEITNNVLHSESSVQILGLSQNIVVEGNQIDNVDEQIYVADGVQNCSLVNNTFNNDLPLATNIVEDENQSYDYEYDYGTDTDLIGYDVGEVTNAQAGDKYVLAQDPDDSANLVGRFDFTNSTALRSCSITANTDDINSINGLVMMEHRIRFSPSDTSPLMNMYYRITIYGRTETGDSIGCNMMQITPCSVSGLSNTINTSSNYLPGYITFTPDKWYTIKIGIDTENNKFHFFYKDDNIGVWRRVTPADGYIIQRTAYNGTNSLMTFKYGVEKVMLNMFASSSASGSMYHDDMKVYTVNNINEILIQGVEENFENYDIEDTYNYHYGKSTSKTPTTSGIFFDGTKQITQKIVADPVNTNNQVNMIKIPSGLTSAVTSKIDYFGFDNITGKVLLRFKVRTSADLISGTQIYLYFGNRFDEDTYTIPSVLPIKLTFGNSTSGFQASTTGTNMIQLTGGVWSPNTWYDVAITIDTTTEKYEIIRKDLSGNYDWINITPQGGYYLRDYTTVNYNNFNYFGLGITAPTNAANDGYIYLDDLQFINSPETLSADLPILQEMPVGDIMPYGGILATSNLLNGWKRISENEGLVMTDNKANMIIALYDNNKQLITVKEFPNTINSETYIQNIYGSLSYPSEKMNDYKIKVFVWEDETIKPLTKLAEK